MTIRSSVFFCMTAFALAACGIEIPQTPSSTFDEPSVSADPTQPADGAPSASSNPAGSGETAIVKIDNESGGEVALSDGTKIVVPAGALPPGVDTISVTSSTVAAPSEYKVASPMYVFGPDGTVFLKPIKVSVPFTMPAGASTDKLTVLWSRARGDGFDMVPTEFQVVDAAAGSYVAVGEVTHFSRGMCGEKFENDPHPTEDPYAK